MDRLSFEFDTEIWETSGKGKWTFVTLPVDAAEEIRFFTGPRRGWGSVRVAATIGETEWKTSIFPDSKRDSYVLPIKSEVRRAEKVKTGDTVTVTVRINL